jgi:hypothetical protein
VPIVCISGSLNLLEPSGTLQACTGIAFTVTVSEVTNAESDSNGDDDHDILHSNDSSEMSHLSAEISTKLENRPNIYSHEWFN